MIGILCSKNKAKGHAEILHSLHRKQKGGVHNSIMVFTISEVDFNNRRVLGYLISGEKIEHVNKPLPHVIYNLSMQREKDGIKKLRLLTLMDGVTLVNDINRFDQWMMMDMLSASEVTARYMLPYNIYDKRNRSFKPDDNKSYIAMPARGSSLSRLIFTKPESNTGRVIGSQYFKRGHICDYIDASLCQRYWIFIELSEILTSNNSPVVIRVYLQRGSGGVWNILGTNTHPMSKLENEDFLRKANKASLIIANHINKFIPSLGYCFLDFMLSAEGNPFFLHLSGFNKNFLHQKQNSDFYNDFYKNLIELTDFYISVQKGE